MRVQINPNVNDVPSLPEPPFLESMALESPWLGVIALAVVAAVLWWWFNRVGQVRRAVASALAALLVAGGLYASSALVTTTREELVARTDALVASTAGARPDALAPLLAEDVRVLIFGRDRGFTRESLLTWVPERLREGSAYAVRGHSTSRHAAVVDGPNLARSQVRVFVQPEAYGPPTGSTWRINWRKDADGVWRVIQIDALQIDFVPQDSDVGGIRPG